ncbi:hypothetical protein [Empedobacter stercoris]|uniref:hypothetical protein n=1 Tax=Empedobacter stercoris TaxID=1628248 RepID=UPI001CE080A4|nr:hypothetical protein [Empedobacter stercoris]MCA4777205.1 hypothetical protein [Empedobacter stercoris]
MKKLLILYTIIISSICSAQIKEISDSYSNYILATIYRTDYLNYQIYNRSLFLNIFSINDSKETSTDSFNETDEVLQALIISVSPDGDYYTTSKLYKIDELIFPKIVEINETKYPEFIIKIETGMNNNRIVKEYKINSN